ncbi:histidine-phosphotransfer domain HPT domain-containing protein [Filobasidium floriforme]|uniref:histidine-phosphotransfer domain HPT domain-containing protein n=1 Tax=Filobasidium floriforme TaxID=5210 RepID=UPI001E8D800D|nr:histidine-phosphotransfer domain HPT domain-containing protein [Filobasidium floriforme]KAH8079989.1 histidine-phosphotransfer domain HPT domain-containing protein [Filobasidium floriforme]
MSSEHKIPGKSEQGGKAGAPAERTHKDKKEPPRDPEGIIDMDILGQVFEMDELEDEDDEDGAGGGHEFSKGIVWNYFEQAESTFEKMYAALESKDLPQLSSLGHFLKGSSAALGVSKVKDSCEKMQHYGNLRDEEAAKTLSDAEALQKIKELLVEVEEEYEEAAEWLKRYYREQEEDL